MNPKRAAQLIVFLAVTEIGNDSERLGTGNLDLGRARSWRLLRDRPILATLRLIIFPLKESEIELQCELNQPRVIARRDDAPEVAGAS